MVQGDEIDFVLCHVPTADGGAALARLFLSEHTMPPFVSPAMSSESGNCLRMESYHADPEKLAVRPFIPHTTDHTHTQKHARAHPASPL